MAPYLYIPLHMTGHIPCPVLANPPMTSLVWFKDDHPLEISHHRNLRLHRGSTLIIEPVTLRDEGVYSCIPHSVLGEGKKSSGVKVFVRDHPRFLTRPDSIYQRQPTQFVSMPCVASGDPRPSITWKKVSISVALK
ncbi:hypothetical protein HELRODRAFT_181903 [Helobdella robusta]|uniref:Ig-like domain-containing protein n=1 Tax=Helobdella robusta TaxID=6412 RepID=T1FHG1_HELRO|nr:hypothetical protein HELRODRAFT_181903 [Helobdella robusta]ESN91979.1 hypothetical protein HELRODRAFT_181903 [Helobdella robusta]